MSHARGNGRGDHEGHIQENSALSAAYGSRPVGLSPLVVCCCRCLLARPIARQAEARIRWTIGQARPTLLAGPCRQCHIGRDVVVVGAGAQRGNLAEAGQAGEVAVTDAQPGCGLGGTDQHQRPLQGGPLGVAGLFCTR
jgi:hypothetical protein